MKKVKLILQLLIVLMIFLCACKDQVSNYNYGDGGPSVVVIKDTVIYDGLEDFITPVTDSPSEIVSYSELEDMPRGTKMKLRINRENFEVWYYPLNKF